MSAPKGGKRALSMRSQDSSNSNSNSLEGADGENTRPLLSDMKMMVWEGESLLSSDGVAGSGQGGGEREDPPVAVGGRSTMSSRELSKAQTVVEVAEEVRTHSLTFLCSCVRM